MSKRNINGDRTSEVKYFTNLCVSKNPHIYRVHLKTWAKFYRVIEGSYKSKFRTRIYGRNTSGETLKGSFPLFQSDGLVEVIALLDHQDH